MNKKPDRITAMQQIMTQVKATFPLTEPDTFVCGPEGNCQGCPKKLLELVDSEISYWEAAIEHGNTPLLGDISRFAKLCKNVKRGLDRNGVIEKYRQYKQPE
ncbi:hypothetical protein J8L86_12835 [Shewanella sp. MMG014]|uniref:hypothetical protein n=1 Tax=Shewanella sp. MMG014 TaxID=2822691 RepID=UPI001B37FDCC|nr:hypothetical protein [Shewanella sp. MMG014]MBQ4890739.1 hypothetical protein [Shewanella sp. MMG014]